VIVGLIVGCVLLIPLEGLGLLALLVLTPALIRLFRAVPSTTPGRPATAGEVALGVTAGIALLGLVVLAAGILFTAICFPIGLAGVGSSSGAQLIVVGFGLGALVAGAAVYLIIRFVFPPRSPSP
jgi:hypothetical protein